jgi:4-diphosphocytidyl-2-C-methyl-D-erythritol kinase
MLGMLTVPAPAKINLTLEVLARRADGYHGIRSVMVPLELADVLTIEPSPHYEFACDRSDLNTESNLAARAIHALGTTPPVLLRLHKRIPVQAGLGGGSSDAAAVLRAAISGRFRASIGSRSREVSGRTYPSFSRRRQRWSKEPESGSLPRARCRPGACSW